MPAKQAAGNGRGRLDAAAPRGLLKERAYEAIKRAILGGDYPPGTFLAERQLAGRLGMSKTPVKAALERLELEGFLTVSPQQGIVVREMTLEQIADTYELRAAVESYVLRTVAGRLTAEQAARVRANLAQHEAIVGAGDVGRGVALDTAFHALFVEFLGNGEIGRLMAQLREKIQRIIGKVFQLNPGRIDSSYAEHRAIAEAVLAGDGDGAARLIEEHLRTGKQMILSPRRQA
jgi:DNA-binding GntR family transcriptional regulator